MAKKKMRGMKGKIYNEIMSRAKLQGNGKKPGEKYREQQLAASMRERGEYMSMAEGVPITGNVSTKQDIARKKRALRRQQRLRQTGGRSAY
jgi:hypothetical protein